MQAFSSIIVSIMLLVFIVVLQITQNEHGQRCSRLDTWLRVYGGLLALAAAFVASAAHLSATRRRHRTLLAISCCHSLVGLFGTAWWITGIVWYTQAEDAGCAKPTMDLMLGVLLLPAVAAGVACCSFCCMGMSMLVTLRLPPQQQQQQQLSSEQTRCPV